MLDRSSRGYDMADKSKDTRKDPAAVKLGKKGGKEGGPARAEKLTPGERTAIAKKGGEARWHKSKKNES